MHPAIWLFFFTTFNHRFYPYTIAPFADDFGVVGKLMRIPFPFDKSVWSMMKMGYTSTLFFFLFQKHLTKVKYSFLSVTLGSIAFAWLTPMMVFGYSVLINREFLWLNTLLFGFNSFVVEQFMKQTTQKVKSTQGGLAWTLLGVLHALFIAASVKHSFGVDDDTPFKYIFDEESDEKAEDSGESQ
jgi:hypothetical protein